LKPDSELKMVLVSGLVFATLTAFLMRNAVFSIFSFAETVVVVKIFFTSLNIILLSGLLVNYTQIYREMPTSTSRSFLIFSASLLLYALAASPLIRVMLGFQTITVGPFTYLPDMFASLAAVAILRESYK